MVCGLAWRCWTSRSVKNACNVGAISVMTGPPTSGVLPGGGQRQQFGRCRQVPVGGRRFAVTQVSRQRRDLGLHVLACAIPAEQGADGEGVSEVVQPRRRGRASADASVVDELPECQLHDGVEQPFAVEGHEEGRFGGVRLEVVAQLGVALECLHAAGVQGTRRDLPNLDSRISSTP